MIIQHGFTPVEDDRIIKHNILNFDQMMKYIREASLVVTHGSSTAMLVCHAGIKPLVVPRDPAFGEQIDAHQIEFVQATSLIYPFAIATTKKEFFAALSDMENIRKWTNEFEIGGKKAIVKFKDEFEKLVGD